MPKYIHWIRSLAGGAGVFIEELSIALNKRGVKNYIIEHDKTYAKSWGTNIRSEEIRKSTNEMLLECSGKHMLDQVINRVKPDIIFYHLWHLDDKKKWSNDRSAIHVAWIHTSRLPGLYGYDKYFFVSYSQLNSHSYLHNNRYVIKNGINLDSIDEVPSKEVSEIFRLCRVSGLSKSKISIDFLRLLSNIKKLPCEFIIIGDGDGKRILEMYIEKNRIKNVYLLGDLGFKDVISWYKSSNLVLYMTGEHIENHSISILEAQACGLPVICENKGGLPEQILQFKTGIICDNNKKMINSIKMLMDDMSYLNKMSLNAKRYANFFNIDDTVDELMRLLEK